VERKIELEEWIQCFERTLNTNGLLESARWRKNLAAISRLLIIVASLTSLTSYKRPASLWAKSSSAPQRVTVQGVFPFYVDQVAGSDENPGTASQPWRTIQKAADTMGPGDTCMVRAGTYTERVQIDTSGTPQLWITYLAEEGVTLNGFNVRADYVIIRGFNITDTPCSWSEGYGIFSQGNHLVIENNEIYECSRGGIGISGSYGIVKGNQIYRNGLIGLDVAGSYHLVEDNEIWGTTQRLPDCTLGGADADGIYFFGSGHIFRDNHIHSITYEDPLVQNAHIDAFQTWGGASDILFESNRIHLPVEQTANEKGVGWMLRDATNLTMINNVLDVHTGVNPSPGNNSGIKFYYNTLVSRPWFSTWNAGFIFTTHADVRNNIFIDFYQALQNQDQDDIVAANCAWNTDGSTPFGSGDYWGINPVFVDLENEIYKLRATSPLIDQAVSVTNVSNDYDDIIRPQGSNPDIGAYEYPKDQKMVANRSEMIIDNTDAGFKTAASEDVWREYVNPDLAHYGISHHTNAQGGTGEDTAAWTFRVPAAGIYEVYARWLAGPHRPDDVPYTVHHHEDSTTVRVNQRIDGGQWNLLGSFVFYGEGEVTLSDDVSSGQEIVADAIRLVWSAPAFSINAQIYLPLIMSQRH
jgi:hypothetical protein